MDNLMNFDILENVKKVNHKLPEPLIPAFKAKPPSPSLKTSSSPQGPNNLALGSLLLGTNFGSAHLDPNNDSLTDLNNPFDNVHKVSSQYLHNDPNDPFEINKGPCEKDLELKDGTT
jgi:hypothetical protein